MKRYLVLFLVSGLTALATAQESVKSPLTWEDCVILAARNNPDLLASLASMEASRADHKGTFNGILPKITLANSYTRNRTTSGLDNESWALSGSANLDLINVGQWATIQSSLVTYKQSQAASRVTASDILLELYRSFSTLLYNQEAIQVDTAILESWKTNSQLVALRYQSGRESKGNNLNTQAQLIQAQASLDQSIRGLRVAQTQLSETLGQETYSALRVTGTWTAAAAPRRHPDFDAILIKQPRLQVQESVVERARLGIKSAHSALWPTLSLNYTQGTQGDTEFPQTPFRTYGARVTLPIFGEGPTAAYYASASAEQAHLRARQDLRALRSQIQSELETAWSAYVNAEDEVRVQQAFLRAAKQRKEESDVRYRSGLMSFENWIIVVQEFVNFQKSYLRAEQSLILAEAQWRYASGEQLAG